MVGVVNKFHLYAVLMFQTIQVGIWQNFEVPNRMLSTGEKGGRF
jgi:hypothetical protein